MLKTGCGRSSNVIEFSNNRDLSRAVSRTLQFTTRRRAFDTLSTLRIVINIEPTLKNVPNYLPNQRSAQGRDPLRQPHFCSFRKNRKGWRKRRPLHRRVWPCFFFLIFIRQVAKICRKFPDDGKRNRCRDRGDTYFANSRRSRAPCTSRGT